MRLPNLYYRIKLAFPRTLPEIEARVDTIRHKIQSRVIDASPDGKDIYSMDKTVGGVKINFLKPYSHKKGGLTDLSFFINNLNILVRKKNNDVFFFLIFNITRTIINSAIILFSLALLMIAKNLILGAPVHTHWPWFLGFFLFNFSLLGWVVLSRIYQFRDSLRFLLGGFHAGNKPPVQSGAALSVHHLKEGDELLHLPDGQIGKVQKIFPTYEVKVKTAGGEDYWKLHQCAPARTPVS